MDVWEECSPNCRSRVHGEQLSSVIRSSALTDEEVASYLTHHCGNFSGIRNAAGQSLAYVAASAGRLKVLRWLLHLRDSRGDVDEESNYSLLHGCLLHGQIHCGVRLIAVGQLGINLAVTDNDFFTPIEIVTKDRMFFDTIRNEQEVYVWGSNTTYNLGCGHNKERATPEIHDFFYKAEISVKQVGIEKFHSVFLSTTGQVWGCGLGVRAGLGVETTALEPRRLPLPDVVALSVGEQHTLFLTSAGTAFSCGLNSGAALGLQQRPPTLAVPKPIRGLPPLKGIFAAQFHSVFYSDNQLFTCGMNIGQLGHPAGDGDAIVVPREVTAIKMKSSTISCVAASAGATVVLNSEGAVYLLSGFRCTRLTPRDWLLKSRKVAVVGGPTGVNEVELRVALLTNGNLVYIWRADINEFLPTVFSIRRELKLFDLVLTTTGCLFTTQDGEAFMGYFRHGKKSKTTEVLDVKRLAHVHRGGSVAADSRGRNFAVLQTSPKKGPEKKISDLMPADCHIPSLQDDLGTLLDDATEDDNIHDVILKVAGSNFPAHTYIIFHSNPDVAMKKLFVEANGGGKKNFFDLGDLPIEAFKSVLRYAYTMKQPEFNFNQQNTLNDKTIFSYEAHLEKKGVNKKEVGDVHFVARRLGVAGLLQALDNKAPSFKGLIRKAGTFDIVLVSEDNMRIYAHKCILVSRLEFFRVMLTHGWRESQQKEVKVPVSGRILEVLVEFLYTDRSLELEKTKDVEFLNLVLMTADEFLCDGLKKCAGDQLQRLVTLRNAPDLLQLASTCNAQHLKFYTQIFILTNLAAFLEARSLDILPDNRLEELSCIYRNWLPQGRRYKNSLDAMEVALVRSLAEAYPINLDGDLEIADTKSVSKQSKRKRERKTSERQRLTSCDSNEDIGTSNTKVNTTSLTPIPTTPLMTVTNPPDDGQSSIPEQHDKNSVSSIVQRRLKVILENVNSPLPVQQMAQVSLKDFPELDDSRQDRYIVKSKKTTEPKKFTKLSQRERRRLLSMNEDVTGATGKEVTSPPRNAWAPLPSLTPSPPLLPITSNPDKISHLEAIIDAERAERERTARMRSKPLALTQMEDRALRELEQFYNVAQATDERITVQRLVSPTVTSPPVWPVSRWR